MTREAAGEIEIDAPVEAVWKALTDARELERWFPLEARVEPGEGGAIWMSWKNEFEGEQRILKWDPPRHLRTTWEMHEGDQPPQVTDYRLETRGGKTIVRVVTSGFPSDASWDEWVQGTIDGWAFELRSLKHYLERHRGKDREVVYLRRRVALAPEEIWSRMAAPGALGGRPLGAEPILETPPRQWAAIVEKLDGALDRAARAALSGGPRGLKARGLGASDGLLLVGRRREGYLIKRSRSGESASDLSQSAPPNKEPAKCEEPPSVRARVRSRFS